MSLVIDLTVDTNPISITIRDGSDDDEEEEMAWFSDTASDIGHCSMCFSPLLQADVRVLSAFVCDTDNCTGLLCESCNIQTKCLSFAQHHSCVLMEFQLKR